MQILPVSVNNGSEGLASLKTRLATAEENARFDERIDNCPSQVPEFGLEGSIVGHVGHSVVAGTVTERTKVVCIGLYIRGELGGIVDQVLDSSAENGMPSDGIEDVQILLKG